MSALSKILRDTENNGLMFWCPGCDGAHRIQHGSGDGPRWGWNGSADKPTFTPSILTRYTKTTEKGEADMAEWRAGGYKKLPDGFSFDHVNMVCHSFVTDGRIQFLGDCTHKLAGQTVDIPDWPDDVC
ncbi:MAG: DUF6527 family protein [Sideroxydans sp.]